MLCLGGGVGWVGGVGGESVRNASAATFIGACGYKIQIPVHNQARGAINVGMQTHNVFSFIHYGCILFPANYKSQLSGEKINP